MSTPNVNNADLNDDDLTAKHQQLLAEAFDLVQQLQRKRLEYRTVEREIQRRPTLTSYAAQQIGR